MSRDDVSRDDVSRDVTRDASRDVSRDVSLAWDVSVSLTWDVFSVSLVATVCSGKTFSECFFFLCFLFSLCFAMLSQLS